MNEFGVTPEKITEQAERLQSTVTSIHQIELKHSVIYHEIQSIGGDVSRFVAKSLISCAVSISNEHDKLDNISEKLSDIAQCYQNAENIIANEKFSEDIHNQINTGKKWKPKTSATPVAYNKSVSDGTTVMTRPSIPDYKEIEEIFRSNAQLSPEQMQKLSEYLDMLMQSGDFEGLSTLFSLAFIPANDAQVDPDLADRFCGGKFYYLSPRFVEFAEAYNDRIQEEIENSGYLLLDSSKLDPQQKNRVALATLMNCIAGQMGSTIVAADTYGYTGNEDVFDDARPVRILDYTSDDSTGNYGYTAQLSDKLFYMDGKWDYDAAESVYVKSVGIQSASAIGLDISTGDQKNLENNIETSYDSAPMSKVFMETVKEYALNTVTDTVADKLDPLGILQIARENIGDAAQQQSINQEIKKHIYDTRTVQAMGFLDMYADPMYTIEDYGTSSEHISGVYSMDHIYYDSTELQSKMDYYVKNNGTITNTRDLTKELGIDMAKVVSGEFSTQEEFEKSTLWNFGRKTMSMKSEDADMINVIDQARRNKGLESISTGNSEFL